ncbi:MAG: nucleotidyltransferase domain-containing protein [Thermodesulfobacteriota bacterium]
MKSREEIINILKNFFKEKNENYGIEMVFLYGSWAAGSPKENSDVDIAITFKKEPTSDEELFDSLNDISLFLSKELGLEVNAIPIRPDFPKPMLYYNAIVSGIPVFIENNARYITIRNEAIFQMEDFNLFGTGWQIRIARKNLEELKHD